MKNSKYFHFSSIFNIFVKVCFVQVKKCLSGIINKIIWGLDFHDQSFIKIQRSINLVRVISSYLRLTKKIRCEILIKITKGPKLKFDFIFQRKKRLLDLFSDNIEGLNFLKKILFFSDSALQSLKTIPNTAHFLGFFFYPKVTSPKQESLIQFTWRFLF